MYSCTILNASNDADLLIVQTTVKLTDDTPTVVIGEDTDLLVLLLHHAEEDCKTIYFKSDVKKQLKKEESVGHFESKTSTW